jgi:hypothetical protein
VWAFADSIAESRQKRQQYTSRIGFGLWSDSSDNFPSEAVVGVIVEHRPAVVFAVTVAPFGRRGGVSSDFDIAMSGGVIVVSDRGCPRIKRG